MFMPLNLFSVKTEYEAVLGLSRFVSLAQLRFSLNQLLCPLKIT